MAKVDVSVPHFQRCNYGRILGPMSHPVGNVIYQIRLLKKDSNLVDQSGTFFGTDVTPCGQRDLPNPTVKKGTKFVTPKCLSES